MEIKDDINFERYAAYYDLIYSDKDYRAETEYVHSLLLKNMLTCGAVLELGSGTGRHGRMLGELGYEVTGVEISPEMLKKSSVTSNFKHVLGDIKSFRSSQKFDAVISLFHVVSYQVMNHEVESVFKTANVHLEKGGLFIFDIWYGPAVCELKPETRVKRFKNECMEISRIAESEIHPNENCVDVNYTLFAKDRKSDKYDVVKESHRLRFFSIPELSYVASKNEFELVGAEEFLSGARPSEKTWGVCFVMRKI